jgi:hypothetical protein
VVRRALTAAVLLFLGLFLMLPLAVVFIEAFAAGPGAYLRAVRDPDALAALRLTLIAAAIAVPVRPPGRVPGGRARPAPTRCPERAATRPPCCRI